MKNATTLMLIDVDTPDSVIANEAEISAQNQIHLSCLILGSGPELSYSTLGIPPYGMPSIPEDWGDQIEAAHQKQNERVQQVEQILSRSNVSGDVQSAFCVTSEFRLHVARKACISDIACIAPNLRDAQDTWREAAHGVLFLSPIGLMLNGSPGSPAKHVFIAWDSSKAAARAVHAALPYLKTAYDVVIACFDPVATADADGADPGTGLAAWLSHHGCKVTVSQFPSGGKEIAQCIMDRARETGADLAVMGAYGHARMLQAIFGGTTRKMIGQTALPVLLAH